MEVNKFNRIELHDSILDELYFDFASKTIKIVASANNDTTKEYDSIAIWFKNVEGVKLETIDLIDSNPIEIFSSKAEIKDNCLMVKFVLLIDRDEVELSFQCKMIEIDLSEEIYLQHLKRD